MFENVDGLADDRRMDAGVTGMLLTHTRAFGSGELTIGGLPGFEVLCTVRDYLTLSYLTDKVKSRQIHVSNIITPGFY